MSEDSRSATDLVIQLYPKLLAKLRGRHRGAEAEDIVQDLFLRLLQLPVGHRITRPKSFIFRATSNIAIDRHRRSRPPGSEDPDVLLDPAPSVDRQIDGRRRLAVLRRVVEDMPERQRRAFVLAKYHNTPHEQIARDMGISLSAVEKLLGKALARCKSALEDLS